MRIVGNLFLMLLFLPILAACTEGGLAEPIALPPNLPTVTLIPTASPLPVDTPAPPATRLEVATVLPTAPPLATSTPLPTVAPLPTEPPPSPPTALPTMVDVEAAPVLPIPPSEHDLDRVTIEEHTWPVELAITPAERQQGLSGRPSLPENTGMLFIFEQDQHLSFWMFDMKFPLDMVWIDSTCHVVDVTPDVPHPDQGQEPADLPRYSPSDPARFVLEINGGEFDKAGLAVGALVRFSGPIAGEYGC